MKFKTSLTLILLASLLAALLGLVRVPSAHAQSTITVSTCDESHLDAAINQANSDNADDTIAFSCSGDILLTSTLNISGSMTLDGDGKQVTLDGGNSVEILYVNSGVTFTLKAFTIAHGSASCCSGGGLFNDDGTVSIANSTFANNSGGDGGGLATLDGTLTITNSTFANNSAAWGGGLWNGSGVNSITGDTSSTVSISNSTFANNSVSDGGGGLFNVATDGTVSISNSTFANNSAGRFGGGLDGVYTHVSIANSTFANNSAPRGGGVNNEGFGGSVSIGGSIVAENTGGNCSGGISDQGYNLESGTDCNFTTSTDQQNTDPQLDSNGLQNNGGPTQTIALQQGSSAIDYIPVSSSNNCPKTDQRGDPRPDGTSESKCDIGAYESSYPPVLTANVANVSTVEGSAFSGTVATGTYSGAGTLSATINWGDGSSSAGTVSLNTDGSYSVTGSHTYAEEGSFDLTVQVSASGGQSATATGKAAVVDAPLTITRLVVGATGKGLAGLAATFTDADPAGTVSDYSATISWGDGVTSAGLVATNPIGAGFVVVGAHQYAKAGTYTVTLTIHDGGGSNITGTKTLVVP